MPAGLDAGRPAFCEHRLEVGLADFEGDVEVVVVLPLEIETMSGASKKAMHEPSSIR